MENQSKDPAYHCLGCGRTFGSISELLQHGHVCSRRPRTDGPDHRGCVHAD